MASPFLGQIGMFGFTFAPRGWAFCNGQILGIAQNSALFALVGTTYGGNGQTTFALPDLQSRVPVHFGQGPGLSPYVLGQQGGAENVTLLTTQIPAHTHALNAFATTGAETVPANGVPANTQGSVNATANTAISTQRGSSSSPWMFSARTRFTASLAVRPSAAMRIGTSIRKAATRK